MSADFGALNRAAAAEMQRRSEMFAPRDDGYVASMIIPVANPIKNARIVTLPGETEDDAWKRYHREVREERERVEAGKYGCGVCGPGTVACSHHPDGVPELHPMHWPPVRIYPSEAWPTTAVADVRYPGLTPFERANRRARLERIAGHPLFQGLNGLAFWISWHVCITLAVGVALYGTDPRRNAAMVFAPVVGAATARLVRWHPGRRAVHRG